MLEKVLKAFKRVMATAGKKRHRSAACRCVYVIRTLSNFWHSPAGRAVWAAICLLALMVAIYHFVVAVDDILVGQASPWYKISLSVLTAVISWKPILSEILEIWNSRKR